MDLGNTQDNQDTYSTYTPQKYTHVNTAQKDKTDGHRTV